MTLAILDHHVKSEHVGRKRHVPVMVPHGYMEASDKPDACVHQLDRAACVSILQIRGHLNEFVQSTAQLRPEYQLCPEA